MSHHCPSGVRAPGSRPPLTEPQLSIWRNGYKRPRGPGVLYGGRRGADRVQTPTRGEGRGHLSAAMTTPLTSQLLRRAASPFQAVAHTASSYSGLNGLCGPVH